MSNKIDMCTIVISNNIRDYGQANDADDINNRGMRQCRYIQNCQFANRTYQNNIMDVRLCESV